MATINVGGLVFHLQGDRSVPCLNSRLKNSFAKLKVHKNSIGSYNCINISSPQFKANLTSSQRFEVLVQASSSLMSSTKAQPLKIMISGAPASGKGTQCELIVQKHLNTQQSNILLQQSEVQNQGSKTRTGRTYGLVHISAGDLLRAEVESGTENGKKAKEYMLKGSLVPDEIVVTIVKQRLEQPDAQENGWLLDGYPRSLSQATALEKLNIRPDLFILLEVPEEILVERVVGRRLDPVTGKIYHLKYSPPETEEIANRLTQRFDDTEEKVKLRLKTHNKNVAAVISTYQDVMKRVDGNRQKEQVFEEIDAAIAEIQSTKGESREGVIAGSDC